jgi:glutathione S-transferase
MIKLYGGARSRASIVRWYLEELGVPYEFVLLDMSVGEHRQAPYTAINPFGKVPGLSDGDVTLFESGAILMYLAERYGEMKDAGVQKRSIANQWILFANATFGPGIFVEGTREKELPRLMSGLEDIFARQEFIEGDRFTVADAAVASMLNYVPMLLKIDLSAYTATSAYLQRIMNRPAFAKTILNRD